MDRRTFLGRVAGGLFAAPFTASAQKAIPTIGFLSGRSPDEAAHVVAAFRQGLKEFGYVEDKNVAI